jgi:hypothetical protein
VITALAAALIGMIIDWLIQTTRHPAAVPTPEGMLLPTARA